MKGRIMSEKSTIHLNAKIAPGDKDWHQGYIVRRDNYGVTINPNRDQHGPFTFYPWHQVTKIEEGR